MGAYLARSLVEHASWRWIYYIYIIGQSKITQHKCVPSKFVNDT